MKFILSLITICTALGMSAQVPVPAMANDESDADVRVNPELETPVRPNATVPFAKYPFLHLNANRVLMNGASWESLAERFDSVAEGLATISIVHIGDSHIQADGNTGKIRRLLQDEYGDAGRGLMIPFRLAGTNQPMDYRITSPSALSTSKLLKMPWLTQMGFTGISVSPQTSRAKFTINNNSAFNTLNIYGTGTFTVDKVTRNGMPLQFETKKHDWGVTLELPVQTSEIAIETNGSNYCLFGFDARREVESEDEEGRRKPMPGILYHAIGNNGATFSSYANIGGMGHALQPLTPDLVILSLGSNEAFGQLSDATFTAMINRLVTDIRTQNPEARIMLTTPSECQRSVFVSRRKGRRRRGSRLRTYQVNSNVKRLRNVILEYGRNHNIPVYDFYEVAGGDGASTKWMQNKLLSADRIHRTWNGYYLEGELLHQALAYALQSAGLQAPVKMVYDPASQIEEKPKPVVSKINAKNTKKKSAAKKRRTTKKKRSR